MVRLISAPAAARCWCNLIISARQRKSKTAGKRRKKREKMKKQLIFIGILLICSFIYIGNVNALYIGRKTYDQKITLKTGPGNN